MPTASTETAHEAVSDLEGRLQQTGGRVDSKAEEDIIRTHDLSAATYLTNEMEILLARSVKVA